MRLFTRATEGADVLFGRLSVIAAVLQNKLAFAIGKRAAAFNTDHLHLPARWSHFDALDRILGIAIRATKCLSHGWTHSVGIKRGRQSRMAGAANKLGARRFGTALLFSAIRRNRMHQENADTEERDCSDK
jgi:hypothetical protein